MEKRDGGVKVLRKAALILDAFTSDQPALSLSAIGKAADLNLATARRILATLEELELVRQDPRTREYSLGLKLFELGSRVRNQLKLGRVALPIMERVTAECGESTYLAVYDAGEVVYIEIVESPHPLRLVVRVGERMPCRSTGTGRALLAFLPPEQFSAFLQRHPAEWNADGETALVEQLTDVRQSGYAIAVDEYAAGVSAIAAPIRDRTGRVIAALSVCGPATRLSAEALHGLAPLTVTAAGEISAALGGP